MIGMIKLCFCGLRERKGRTALISLSIAIGVFLVLIISVISDNGVKLINQELDTLGICGVSITKNSVDNDELLTNKDLNIIKKQNFVKNATPVITKTGFLKNDNVSSALVCGIDENAKSVISVETILGKKITRNNIVAKEMVCQVDEDTATKLFGKKGPLGQKIDIFLGGTTNTFTVVGVVKASSSILQTSVGDLLPNFIYVPFTTLQNIMGSYAISQIVVSFSEDLENDVCVEKIKSAIGNTKMYNSYLQVDDLNKQRDTLNSLLDIITIVLTLIGGVSLIVSGIGIMTIMLVSVREKTKEIGIKKSIGARKSNIIFEFIFESAFISAIGSIIGLFFMFISVIVAKLLFDIDVGIDFKTVIFTILISILCGIIFGVYPAVKASKLKPIDALIDE